MRRIFVIALLSAVTVLAAALASGCAAGRDTAVSQEELDAVWKEYDLLKQCSAYPVESDNKTCFSFQPDASEDEQQFFFGGENGHAAGTLTIRRADRFPREFSYCGGDFITAPERILNACVMLPDKDTDACLIIMGFFYTDAVVYDASGGKPEPVQTIPGRITGCADGVLYTCRDTDESRVYDSYVLNEDRSFVKHSSFIEYGRPGYTADKGFVCHTRSGTETLDSLRAFELRALIRGAFGKSSAAVFADCRTGKAYCVPVSSSEDGLGVSAAGIEALDINALDPVKAYALACPEVEQLNTTHDWKSDIDELPREEYKGKEMRFDVDGDGIGELLTCVNGGFEEDYKGTLSVSGGEPAECPDTPKAIGRLELPCGECFFITGLGYDGSSNLEVTFIYRYADGALDCIGHIEGELYGITGQGTLVAVKHAWMEEFKLCAYSFEPDAEEGERLRSRSEWWLWIAYVYTHLTAAVNFKAYTADGVITVPRGAEIDTVRSWDHEIPGTDETIFFTYNGVPALVFLTDGYKLEGFPWRDHFTH